MTTEEDRPYTIQDLEQEITELYIKNKYSRNIADTNERCISSLRGYIETQRKSTNEYREKSMMYKRRVKALEGCISAVNRISYEALKDDDPVPHRNTLTRLNNITEQSLMLLRSEESEGL